MRKIILGLLLAIAFTGSAIASTAHIEFTAPPPGAETWVFVGTEDCGVDANGVMADKMKCPNGQIGPEGATSVDVGNVPPNKVIYATAFHYYPATGVTSGYAQVINSGTPSPPLPRPTEPIPFPAPVIIQWPTGTMTITHGE